MTQVTKFDPAGYVDKVCDKIKQSLIDVVPDEQWDALLKAEMTAFFDTKKERSPYGGPDVEKPSEFRRIVLNVLEEETKKKVRELLTTSEWDSYWDGTKLKAGDEIARLARENGAAILAKWLETAIAQVISNIRFTNQ